MGGQDTSLLGPFSELLFLMQHADPITDPRLSICVRGSLPLSTPSALEDWQLRMTSPPSPSPPVLQPVRTSDRTGDGGKRTPGGSLLPPLLARTARLTVVHLFPLPLQDPGWGQLPT